MLTCGFCGRRAEVGEATISWSFAMERGRRIAFCDACSRDHLRMMEGKLDSEHW